MYNGVVEGAAVGDVRVRHLPLAHFALVALLDVDEGSELCISYTSTADGKDSNDGNDGNDGISSQ